jgi:hypothetical protein
MIDLVAIDPNAICADRSSGKIDEEFCYSALKLPGRLFGFIGEQFAEVRGPTCKCRSDVGALRWGALSLDAFRTLSDVVLFKGIIKIFSLRV